MVQLSKIIEQLNEFERDRKFWLRLSAFIIIAIISIIWEWDVIQLNHTEWLFGSIGLIVSAIWWFWTMRVLRMTLEHRKDEIIILGELIADIKSIKNDVSKMQK